MDEYTVVSACGTNPLETISTLEDYVNNYIEMGYKPIGGVSFTKTKYREDCVAVQAMFRE